MCAPLCCCERRRGQAVPGSPADCGSKRDAYAGSTRSKSHLFAADRGSLAGRHILRCLPSALPPQGFTADGLADYLRQQAEKNGLDSVEAFLQLLGRSLCWDPCTVKALLTVSWPGQDAQLRLPLLRP